ncbi:hypothetical protein COUCH_21175 [Couchioplanes caeruleus]|uniref:hypothetical protein n=1 Tax=Couchioplanes caeruleus TaxID=56438 RepID=UPI0020BD4D16|nr:hypothetical protein [Couchioplanes caeruleus]UQU61562.1 hypothetical protein COUCH_21175 [Couchioplanes caeruleus]
MTTTEWPTADPRLERAYHRLLRTYPRRFRAQHGAELVTTLLEMAAPGQRRPTPADALHLLAGGGGPPLPAARTATALTALTLPTIALYGNVMRAFRHAGGDDVAFTVHSA